jgi:hypothetical protein
MSRIRITTFVALMGAVTLASCGDQPDTPLATDAGTPSYSMAAQHSTSMVNWHAQQAALGRTGPVEGASGTIVRNANGVSFRLSTTQLTPGNAYTLWLVVINNPGACPTSPCMPVDLFKQELNTGAQVSFGAGSVAGVSGRGTFAGHVSTGPLSGWLPDRTFSNPLGAEVHLVVNDHGPMLPAHMPGMIHTYRGGCADNSPFPSFFPATALADGEAGPNICRLYQAAIFRAP